MIMFWHGFVKERYISTRKRLHIWNFSFFSFEYESKEKKEVPAKLTRRWFQIQSLLTGLLFNKIFLFSLNSFVPDARFFAFSSTDTESRQEAANFWQVWYNTSFTSQDYGSFFVRYTTSRVTPTVGVSLITDSRQTVEESAATPTYVQTSRTSSGKNIHIQQKYKTYKKFVCCNHHSNCKQML